MSKNNIQSVLNKKEFFLTKHWNKYFDSGETKYLFIIAFIALIIRLAFVIETQNTPVFENLFSDSQIYNYWAVNIVNSGDWVGKEPYFMAPAYPYFIAVVYSIFGQSIEILRILQVLLSSISIFIIYLVGRNLVSKSVGYISAGMTAVYSVFIFYSGSILSETLQLFFYLILYLLLTNKDKITEHKHWFYIGLVLGIAAIFRANILLFIPVVIIWLFFQVRKNEQIKKTFLKLTVFFLIGTSLPILPVTIRNYTVSNEFILLTTNGGINFFIGNNPFSPGVFSAPNDFDFYSDLAGHRYAEKVSGKKLTEGEASSFWFKEGIKYFQNYPLEFTIKTLKKIFIFFEADENPQSSIMSPQFFKDEFSKVLHLPLVSFQLIWILALMGITTAIIRKEKFSLIYLFLGVYVFSTALFFINGRFRVALTPILIFFAAYFLVMLFQIIKENKLLELRAPAVVLISYSFLSAFFVPKFLFNDADAYINIGTSYFEKQDYDRSLIYLRKAVQLKEDPAAYIAIGNNYAVRKDVKLALDSYQKALAINPNLPIAHVNIGLLYSQSGNLNVALQAFSKAIELDPFYADAYRNIGIIHYINNNHAEALRNFERFLELSKNEEINRSVKQDIETLKQILRNR